jgi:hypothetical protein
MSNTDHHVIPADPAGVGALAGPVAARALRTDLDAPGWALLDLGAGLSPRDFRAAVIALGKALDAHYQERFGGRLVLLSVSRFDQQAPTRPHRDGGPDASLLLLGYEATEVPSRLFLLDYTRAAFQRGQTPREFLLCCNPAFGPGRDRLRDHTTEVGAFDPGRFQILVVNNSTLPHAERSRGMLGVLHHAEIDPRPGKSRPIDSVLMAVAGPGVEALSESEVQAFVEAAKGAAR